MRLIWDALNRPDSLPVYNHKENFETLPPPTMLRIATALLIASTSALRIGNQLSSQSAAAVEAELHSGSQAQAASGSQTT